MKHIIILGDGMADHKVASLNNKTLLEYARPEYMNRLAREGRCGRLITVPEGFPPGSEVANTAILGYDLNKVYEGRGPLEAASIGYDMQDDDFAIRCNIITLGDGKIITHNGGNLETDDARRLIDYLNEHLAKPINEREGCERVKFITGIQYRHLLVIKGGNKHIVCAPPHDHPNEPWRPLLVKPSVECRTENVEFSTDVEGCAEANSTLNTLNSKLVMCVPSGNFGNICAALFGHEMGLPIKRFIAANNANDVFYEYLQTGKYNPRPSVQTLANAMDVGDPSNFARIYDLYGKSHEKISSLISGATYSDEQIAATMRRCYQETGYVLDPHGACGYQALKDGLKPGEVGIFCETAHPAKFKEKVDAILSTDIEIPARLQAFMKGQKQSVPMTKNFQDFKAYLMQQ